ncbi:MAG: hypothetical protein ACJAS2_001921, partial [Pseudohongiellaceae bacterium]
GITQELLLDLLDCGREAEAANAQVAYFIGNEAAKKVYRSLGFNETHELLDKDFENDFGTPGVMHMRLEL